MIILDILKTYRIYNEISLSFEIEYTDYGFKEEYTFLWDNATIQLVQEQL